MTRDGDFPEPPEGVSTETIDWIDSLDARELRRLVTYLETRIESKSPSFEDLIEERASGDVRSVDVKNGYAYVKMHPPIGDGSTVDHDVISMYHVTREPQVDGEETLHWAYLGDIKTGGGTRCPQCGRTFDSETDTCPHCGGTGFTNHEDGGDDDE